MVENAEKETGDATMRGAGGSARSTREGHRCCGWRGETPAAASRTVKGVGAGLNMSGGLLRLLAPHVWAQFVAEAQCVLGGDRLFISPHRNGGSCDSQGIGQRLLRAEDRERVFPVDVHCA